MSSNKGQVALITILICVSNLYGQIAQVPLPQLIETIKPSVVAVVALDDTIMAIIDKDTIRYNSFGSAVLISVNDEIFALTNEHVIAIKDSMNNTVRYAKNLQVSLNIKGRGRIQLPAVIYKTDSNLDLAALRVLAPPDEVGKPDIIFIQQSLWKDPSDIKEGETVIYCGFPYGYGLTERNYPLSRIGMVSQIIPGAKTFFIDAFVQPGYSGSPVFLIREEGKNIPPKWGFYFIGIAQAFPFVLKDVYIKVKLQAIPQLKVIENPGFANVIGISAIREFFNLPKK